MPEKYMEEYDPAHPNNYDARTRDISMHQDIANRAVGVVDGNIGSKLLKKMGWTEGEGLGKKSQGSTEPIIARKVNKGQAVLEHARKLSSPSHSYKQEKS